MEDVPGCDSKYEVTDSGECSTAARSLDYSDSGKKGSWEDRPKGCFVSYPGDGEKRTFFNSHTVGSRNTRYKSICKRPKG